MKSYIVPEADIRIIGAEDILTLSGNDLDDFEVDIL